MSALVVSGTVYRNIPLPPTKIAGVFEYGPCTTGDLCRVNEPVLSYGFVVVKCSTALVPTMDTPERTGCGALTASVAEGVTVPAALTTATEYVPASANWALVMVSVFVVTPE